MAEYLVELYVAQGDQDVAQRHAESAEQAGAELTREGRPVRCLRSIFVPEDETCFFLCEAESIDAVRELAQRAGLQFERVVEVAPDSTHSTDNGAV
jgi:hypothetical protein